VTIKKNNRGRLTQEEERALTEAISTSEICRVRRPSRRSLLSAASSARERPSTPTAEAMNPTELNVPMESASSSGEEPSTPTAEAKNATELDILIESTRSLGKIREGPKVVPTTMPWSYGEIRRTLAIRLASEVPAFLQLGGKIVQNGVESLPTVIIVIPHNFIGTTKREEVLQLTHNILRPWGLPVEVLHGSVGHSDGKEPRNPDYHQHVSCGASIGPRSPLIPNGGEWAGSFGGYLRNKMNGEVYGLTCAHNLCRYPADLGRPEDELLELLPIGTAMEQPALSDHRLLMKGLDDAIIEFDERRKAMKERMEEVSEVDERKLAANLKSKMQCVRERNFQDARDKSFAVSTRFSELMVEGDTLYDYALLSIVAQERKNTCNQMPAVGAPVVLTGDPGLKCEDGEEVHMVGRTTGSSKGKIKGILIDGKVERLKDPFQCRWVYGEGRAFSEVGDSGSWVRAGGVAIGYIFGGGYTDEIKLESSWLCGIDETLKRIKARWGIDLEVWNPEE